MTISKRNGKYYCRFQIDGERHHYLCSGATSVSEAKKIEDGFKYKLQQQQNGIIAKEDKTTLSTLCNMYWNYAQANNSDLKHVKSKIKYIKDYFGGSKLLSKITPTVIVKYKTHLIQEGKKPSTVNKYRSTLIKMFNIAIENGLIKTNPCCMWKKMIEDNIKTVYWTKEETKLFYQNSPRWLSDLVYLALATGLRKTNIRLFEKEWIDFDRKVIQVPKTQNKGRKFIQIPLTDSLCEFLQKKSEESINEKYLFVNSVRNKPHSDKKIDTTFREVCVKCNISNIGFHGLRHTFGTRLGENGVDVVVIQELLAHTTVATTLRYRHTTESKLKEAMSVLNSYN